MKKYLVNSVWVLLERIIKLVVMFVFFSLISRELSVFDFGIFSLSQTVFTLLAGIVVFGFDNVLIKEFSTNSNNEKFFSTAIISRLLLSFFCVLIFCIVIFFMDYSDTNKFVFIASSLGLFFQIQTIYYSYYQATSSSFIITKTSALALIISSIIKSIFIYYKLGIVYYALSFSLDYFFSCLFIYYVSRRNNIKVLFKNFDCKILKLLFIQSFPILLSTLIVMIYTRIDQFMIASMLGVEDVAKFSVAVRISDAYMFIPMAISVSFLPMVSRDPSGQNIQKYFHLTHFFTFFSGAFVIILSPIVINYFFGVRYHDSIAVVNIIVFANIISALGAVSSNILILRGITYLRIYRAIAGLVVNIGLNFYCIPKFGILGAAYSSLLSQVIAAWISNGFSKKTVDCFYFQSKSLLTFGIPSVAYIYNELRSKRIKDGE
ncbi:flippase [Klebsiella pneumoniae]|uniref:flippase n=1 Tax=Klebsiella pneumoniae TaxID=573 RepID=UPI001E5E17DA|nr:flippase [Klebsiella pneumoniae]MCC4962817.1 flippase [Klebsiella pneumoniae]HBX7998873.1 flippase [Klebsiella pneumoniae]